MFWDFFRKNFYVYEQVLLNAWIGQSKDKLHEKAKISIFFYCCPSFIGQQYFFYDIQRKDNDFFVFEHLRSIILKN